MDRIDLNTLAQFVVLARHLNFRRAAAELGVAPSTLSERVRELEAQLGVRLLNRTTRSCALTDEGRHLVTRSADATEALDEAVASVRSGDDAIAGRIRVNGPQPAIELRLAPLVMSFLVDHPAARVDLVCQSDLVDIVAEGFDAGVRYDETLAQDMIRVRLGGPQRMVIVASPAYVERRGRPANPADLGSHECIGHVFAQGNALPWSLERGEEIVDFVPRGRLRVNEIDTAIVAARAGVGLAYTFDDYVAADVASGRLVTVLDDWTLPFEGPSLYYPERRLMSGTLRAFVDHVRVQTRAAEPDPVHRKVSRTAGTARGHELG